MTLYEIINPSDAYTIEADNFKLACVVVCVLGNGQYALKEVNKEENSMPLFLFGGHDEWFTSKFGETFSDALNSIDVLILASTLDSVLIGTLRDRELFSSMLAKIESPENRKQALEQWHNTKRSSLNDIGGRARRLAQALRIKVLAGEDEL